MNKQKIFKKLNSLSKESEIKVSKHLLDEDTKYKNNGDAKYNFSTPQAMITGLSTKLINKEIKESPSKARLLRMLKATQDILKKQLKKTKSQLLIPNIKAHLKCLVQINHDYCTKYNIENDSQHHCGEPLLAGAELDALIDAKHHGYDLLSVSIANMDSYPSDPLYDYSMLINEIAYLKILIITQPQEAKDYHSRKDLLKDIRKVEALDQGQNSL